MANKSGRLAVEESDGFVKRRLIDWGDSRYGEHVGVTPVRGWLALQRQHAEKRRLRKVRGRR